MKNKQEAGGQKPAVGGGGVVDEFVPTCSLSFFFFLLPCGLAAVSFYFHFLFLFIVRFFFIPPLSKNEIVHLSGAH